MEIEKKFLLRSMPGPLETYEKKVIEQGYLCTDPVVRIRQSDEEYILTYKSKIGLDVQGESDTRVNQEVEVPLNRQGYEHLKGKVDGHIIRKRRYLIPLEDGHTGELDVFEGALQGLVFIEVEFSSPEDARAFVPPEWFGENVSEDGRYSNSYLAFCHDLTALQEEMEEHYV